MNTRTMVWGGGSNGNERSREIPLSNLPRYILNCENNRCLVIFKSSMVRLTQELIVLAPQFTNALKEREIDLRGLSLLAFLLM